MDSEQKALVIVSVLSALTGAVCAGYVISEIKDYKIHNLEFQNEMLYRIGLGLAGANDEMRAELEQKKS